MVRSVPKIIALLIATLCLGASAFANNTVFIDFQGIQNMQPVGTFYMADYGVSFSSNFLGLTSVFNGGAGDFGATPLGTPAIFINAPTGSPATGVMNVGPGFSSGLNFYFTAGFTSAQTETVTIWSGANGSGTVLATITLANNNGSCGSLAYCNWTDIGATFSGTAHSVTFSGPANELGVTDITLGSSVTAIPEPSSIYLLGTGLVGVSVGRIRRYLGV